MTEFIGKKATVKKTKQTGKITEVHETLNAFKIVLVFKDGSSKIYKKHEVIGPLRFNGCNGRCSSCDNNYNQAAFRESRQNGFTHPCYPCNGTTNTCYWEMAFGA